MACGALCREESKFAHFDGFVFSKTGVAQISADLEDLGAGEDDVVLRRHEGVLLRLKGDGKRYSVSLRERGDDGRTFIAPFTTTGKWQIVRIPFNQFRPEVFNRAFNEGGDKADLGPPMDLNNIQRVGIRFEARNQSSVKAKGAGGGPAWMTEMDSPSNNSFGLALEYVKLLPKGEETDFVLLSCGGASMPEVGDGVVHVSSTRFVCVVQYVHVSSFRSSVSFIRPDSRLDQPWCMHVVPYTVQDACCALKKEKRKN